MAAPMKRAKPNVETEIENIASKKPRTDASDEKLDSFLRWCDDNGFNVTSKVKVGREGSCAQYGMVAVEDIPEGYCLFQVPRSCLLMPQNSNIAEQIQRESVSLSATNQWVPLLVSLLHEQNDRQSRWRPYLDLVPDYPALDLPMFWDRCDVEKFLKGTGVDVAVERDLEMIQKDFDQLVVPFFEKYRDLRDDAKDLEYFKKMVAFVMAYSFTEPKHNHAANTNNNGTSSPRDNSDDDEDDDEEEEGSMHPPMMVPMADMLNHVTDNNAKLTFGTQALKMVATRDIRKGEEIFNTYGQVSNLHLMHMYGFAEPFPDNTNDVVEIPARCLYQAARDLSVATGSSTHQALLDSKWKSLGDQEILCADDVIVLGREGVITDDTCAQALKVLCMSPDAFTEFLDQEGWSDAESDSSLSGESKLSFERIQSVSDSWKHLLQRTAQVHLAAYPRSLSQDQNTLTSPTPLPPRERFSVYTAHGQKALLRALVEACGGGEEEEEMVE